MTDRQQEKKQHISSNDFNITNTKSDPSQQGSPVPFQQGDFASVDKTYASSKSFAEILSFYATGIALTITSFYVFVTRPIFKSILDHTLLSFAIALGMMVASFIVAHFLTTQCTKRFRKRKR